jgi:hypothetical protein
MDRVCSTHIGDMRIVSKILVKISKGKRPVVTATFYTKLPVTNAEQQKISPLKTHASLK